MGCISTTIIFVFNSLFMLLGFTLVGFASYLLNETIRYYKLTTSSQFVIAVPIAVLLLAMLLTTISFFGCCGIIKKSPCMLNTYGSLVLVFLTLQVTCGVLLIVYRDYAPIEIKKGMTQAFEQYYRGTADMRDSIDWAQGELECCGIEKYTDWFSLTPVNDLEETVNSVTRGCCLPEYAKQHGLCYENLRYATIQEVEQRIYTIGCFPRVEQLLDSAVGLAMGIICIIFIVVQFVLMVLSFVCAAMYRGKHDDSKAYNYNAVPMRPTTTNAA